MALIQQQHLQIAIVLTACGIETFIALYVASETTTIAIVLTACGIETSYKREKGAMIICAIAIVLTACGIETLLAQAYLLTYAKYCNSTYRLRY